MSTEAIDYPRLLRRVLRLVEAALGRLGALQGPVECAHQPLSEAIDALHDALDRGTL